MDGPSVEFTVEAEDLLALQQWMLARSPMFAGALRRNRRATLLAIPIAMLLVYAATAPWSASTPRLAGGVLAEAVVLASGAWMYFASDERSRRRVVASLRASARRGELQGVGSRDTITLLDDAIAFSDPTSTRATNWNAVHDAEVAPDGLYLEFADGSTARIPFRVFASDAERTVFMRAVSDRLRARGAPLPPATIDAIASA